jgi:hypothetical protein
LKYAIIVLLLIITAGVGAGGTILIMHRQAQDDGAALKASLHQWNLDAARAVGVKP